MSEDGRRQQRQIRARAFTLVELLVVIAIIAILMGILIPTISKVRIAGFDSATTHRMQALMSAIDAYHQANGAYPGPLADDEVYSAANPTVKAVKNTNGGTLPPGVTSTENLTLGLLGGIALPGSALTATPNGLTLNYDPNAVGNGPTNLNQLAQGKKYGPYADAKACGLENGGTAPWVAWSDDNHNPLANNHSLFADTAIPEFTDSFPDALPILYVRAGGGNTATVAIPGAPAQNGTPPATNAPAVWDPSQLQAYVFPAIKPGTTTVVQIQNDQYSGGVPDSDVTSDFPTPHFYFTQGSDHVTPRQRGGYLLIAAGKDRKYMTHDDRINGSPVQ